MDAGELDESEKVFDVVFPAGYESSEVVHPGEESFDLPPSLVSSEFSPVLRFASVASVRGDQLDVVLVA